jgi:hypothetical protein
MSRYYFVGTSLPPIAIGEKPELSFAELMSRLKMNLTPSDWKKVEGLLWPTDLSNIRAFWMGLPMDEKGLFLPKELEEALLVKEGIPEYLKDYLDRYQSSEDHLRYFPSLWASMYRDMVSREKGFLLKYYTLEREIRLVLTALRAKWTKRDVVRELQFEDPMDPFISYILAQKDASDFMPPVEYADLKALVVAKREHPKELHRALLEYRFQKISEMEEGEYFTIDQILAYTAKLLLVESWQELDEEKGRTLIKELSEHG